MLFSPKMLADIVRNFNGPSPRGVSCRFIKVNDQWGIKVYKYAEERNNAYLWQAAMHKVGLAPAVGIKFDTGRESCYLTQVATPLIDGYTSEKARDMDNWDNKHFEVSQQPGNKEKIKATKEKMREHGCVVYDCHVANFGYLHGELVCIDFGDAYGV